MNPHFCDVCLREMCFGRYCVEYAVSTRTLCPRNISTFRESLWKESSNCSISWTKVEEGRKCIKEAIVPSC